MPKIPNKIGGVTMEFASSVTNEVTQDMLDALTATISTSAVSGETIEKLWISSAKDSHKCPSRHVTGNGVDISRVNGKYISSDYETDASVKSIVDGLQTSFENAPKRRENFGPSIKKKLGKDHAVSGHKDHFHWSVDGDHSACSKSLIERFFDLFRRNELQNPPSEPPAEICNL